AALSDPGGQYVPQRRRDRLERLELRRADAGGIGRAGALAGGFPVELGLRAPPPPRARGDLAAGLRKLLPLLRGPLDGVVRRAGRAGRLAPARARRPRSP